MIDLTNKIASMSVEEIQNLLTKYKPVLELSKKKDLSKLAYIFDIACKYIIEKHNNLNIDFKVWSVIILYDYFDNIKTESDIENNIDKFINYYNENYKTYINNLDVVASIYDRDAGFVQEYEFKNK